MQRAFAITPPQLDRMSLGQVMALVHRESETDRFRKRTGMAPGEAIARAEAAFAAIDAKRGPANDGGASGVTPPPAPPHRGEGGDGGADAGGGEELRRLVGRRAARRRARARERSGNS